MFVRYIYTMSHSITLSQVAARATMLEVACRKCTRHGKLSVARLIAEHGPHHGLPILLDQLTADCQRVIDNRIFDRCGAHFPQLPGWFADDRSDTAPTK
ncbi:MAG TPA: hypothetical protein VGC26_03500 [Afipia sp.]